MLSSSTNSLERKNVSNYPNRNKIVGILGGTFDPIHLAHLIIAETVYTSLQLDEIWFMPTYIPPHKQNKQVTASQHRLQMLALALRNYPEFQICSVELEKGEVSYTYHTMQDLIARYPNHQFMFIIGGDMVEYLPKWYRFEELLNLTPFVAVKRPHHMIDTTQPWMRNVQLVDVPQMDLSSTMIRERCKTGGSIRFLVPEDVERYIKEHRLYVE